MSTTYGLFVILWEHPPLLLSCVKQLDGFLWSTGYIRFEVLVGVRQGLHLYKIAFHVLE